MESSVTDLCYMTATEAITLFKARKLSPVDLMTAVIARCEQVNPELNAITYSFYERSLEKARSAEKKYMKTDGRLRPLEGIPIAIKDFHPVKGEITTFGSKVHDGARAEFTAPTVQRLFNAGAIMHMRTTTPEFACYAVTHSPLWGITRNPWNLNFSPGGSSGGAGAAVASGMTTLADGTDGGGSIRIPASASGIFGFKPPFGRNPTGILPTNQEWLLHFGPMSRSVADGALMQNVMSGPHVADITTLRNRVRIPQHFQDIKGWKIAFSMDLGYKEIDHEVQRNTLAAVEVFRDLGCQVEAVELGWDLGVSDAWLSRWEGLFAALCADLLPRWRFEMDPFNVALIERGLGHDAVRVRRAEFVCTEMYKTLGPILNRYNILICPTLAVPALAADHKSDDPDFRINGKLAHPYIGGELTYPFNLMSQCPVASVPSGHTESGIPTGLQIIGRTFDDVSVFRAAAAFEAAQPWHNKRPEVMSITNS